MNINIFTQKTLFIFAVGLLAFSVFSFFVSAQTTGGSANLPAGVSEDQVKSALSDLSAVTGESLNTLADGEKICNQEKYFSECAEVGKKYKLYSENETKQVDAVLSELKGKVIDDLKNCADETCIANVASRVAKSIAVSNPAVAKALDLTSAKVEEKKVIINAAKEIGVTIKECQEMDPDNASIELLRSCARLAKDARVQKYIPAAVKETIKISDKSIDLREALAQGKYQCGDNTLDGCGDFCLNPSEETRAQGIPSVCKDIAANFFGKEGVKQLENSYQQVRQVQDFYKKRSENFIFTTLDGRKITNPEDIGRYLEEEGGKGNIEAVEKGMDFMITQGFVSPQDKEFALRMVKKAKEQGGLTDFEACRQNPKLCQNFIPEEDRKDFEVFDQIESIMREEIGFSPKLCEQGEFDEKIGLKCSEGSKKALSRLEKLPNQTSQIKNIITDIRQHTLRGDEFSKRRDDIQKVFAEAGGPGGCRSENECRSYCSDPAHGPECIAFGAKNQIFRGDEAIERFQQFNQVTQTPQFNPFEVQQFSVPYRPDGQFGYPSSGQYQFPGQGPFPGYQPPGQGGFPPGQIPGFNQPGPGLYPPPGYLPYSQPFYGQQGGPVGPSPECFSAIQSGDFAKAKELCQVNTSVIQVSRPANICAAAFPIPCQEGQYRKELRNQDGCYGFGECVAIPGYQPNVNRICPSLPTVDSCSAGQIKVVSYSSPECGTYYTCKDGSQQQQQQQCPSGQHWIIPYSGGQGYCEPDYRTDAIKFPYAFPNGYKVNSYEEAKAYCLANGPNTGANIAGECQARFGITYESELKRPIGSPNCADPSLTSPASCNVVSGCGWYYPTEYRTVGYCGAISNYPGDANSCPGFSVSKYDSTGKRYCELVTEKKCDFNYPNYLTNGLNYKTENCPITTVSPPPSPVVIGVCSQELINLLGSGCHNMGNGYFDTEMRRYVLPGSNAVKDCASSYIQSCTTGSTSGGGGSSAFQKCFYPNASKDGKYVGYTVWCESDYSNCKKGSVSGESISLSGVSLGSPSSCESGWSNTCNYNNFCDSWESGASCPSDCGGQTTSPSGQKEQIWNSLGLRSWIRTDADTTRIEQLKQSCANTPSSSNIWLPQAGNSTSPDFGMPDPAKCQKAASCVSGQYFDGTNCVASTGTTSTSCPSGQYWNGTACVASTTTTTCPSGQYWNGTACVTSTTTSTTCPGFAHDMGGYCMLNNNTTSCAEYPNASSEVNYTALVCTARSGSTATTTTTTQTTCSSGQYWNGTACISSTTTSSCSTPANCFDSAICASSGWFWYNSGCWSSPQSGTTTTSSCETKYGSGWHTMDSSGNCFNSSMTEYKTSNGTLYSCSTTPATGCSGSGATQTTCTSGQYWNGTACVSSTTAAACSSGQYWNGTACVNSTTSTICSSGQYWNGTACVSTTSTDCPSGQYWNGTSCVSSTITSTCSTPANCFDSAKCASSGWFWYNSGCWSSPQQPVCGNNTCESGETTSSCSVDCGPPPAYCGDSTCNGSETYSTCASDCPAPPPSTATTGTTTSLLRDCPASHNWNGSNCVVRTQYVAHFIAKIRTGTRSFAGAVFSIIGR